MCIRDSYKHLHGCNPITPSHFLRQYWKEWPFGGNDLKKYKTILKAENSLTHFIVSCLFVFCGKCNTEISYLAKYLVSAKTTQQIFMTKSIPTSNYFFPDKGYSFPTNVPWLFTKENHKRHANLQYSVLCYLRYNLLLY